MHEGLCMLSTALIFCVISLIPCRKGEKWAWYTALCIGGLAILGQLVLIYIGVEKVISPSYLFPLATIMVILWVVGLHACMHYEYSFDSTSFLILPQILTNNKFKKR
jgi:hypothetical protein